MDNDKIFANQRFRGDKKQALLDESKWLYTKKLEIERGESRSAVSHTPIDSLETSQITGGVGKERVNHRKENSRIMR